MLLLAGAVERGRGKLLLLVLVLVLLLLLVALFVLLLDSRALLAAMSAAGQRMGVARAVCQLVD